MLREATERVRGPHPFEPHGTGWTLVTFSVPENQRTLRHRLRSALTWEGFAPLRDGLWLAPGEVDLAVCARAASADLPPGAVTAFHARELPGTRWPTTCARRGTSTGSGMSTSHSSRRGAILPRGGGGHGAGRADDARRGLARRSSGRTRAFPRLHGRGLAGRSLVRGLPSVPAVRRARRGARRRAVRGARRAAQPAKRARRSAFRTLPDAVRGSSSTMTTFLGSL